MHGVLGEGASPEGSKEIERLVRIVNQILTHPVQIQTIDQTGGAAGL
jgi:hypothetical protein